MPTEGIRSEVLKGVETPVQVAAFHVSDSPAQKRLENG
jgi:hypothetical protein